MLSPLLVLEVQLSNLGDLEPPPTSYGITDESFDALCTIGYDPPRPDKAALTELSVTELKSLAFAHRLDAVGCLDKADLVELLTFDAGATGLHQSSVPTAADDDVHRLANFDHLDDFNSIRRQNLPRQCAICMADFRDNEQLKVLPCSDLHAFHAGEPARATVNVRRALSHVIPPRVSRYPTPASPLPHHSHALQPPPSSL